MHGKFASVPAKRSQLKVDFQSLSFNIDTDPNLCTLHWNTALGISLTWNCLRACSGWQLLGAESTPHSWWRCSAFLSCRFPLLVFWCDRKYHHNEMRYTTWNSSLMYYPAVLTSKLIKPPNDSLGQLRLKFLATQRKKLAGDLLYLCTFIRMYSVVGFPEVYLGCRWNI